MSRRLLSVPLAGALLLPAAWLPVKPPLACRIAAEQGCLGSNGSPFDVDPE